MTIKDLSLIYAEEQEVIMDPGRWKSVVVPIDTYRVLRDMAKREHRTISGQFTFLLEKHRESETQIYTAHGQQVVREAAEK